MLIVAYDGDALARLGITTQEVTIGSYGTRNVIEVIE
jgi:hypothetical protein